MPANVYECMFLLDTNKVAGDVPAAAQQLHTLLERNNAEILASRPWDERRLAYTFRNPSKGPYFSTYFRSDGKNLINTGPDLALNAPALRHCNLKIDANLDASRLYRALYE